ncbi:MAG: DsbA family protein, partial [Roseovarius sp.]
MKSLRFAVLAVSILLPLSAFAQELSEERVKELALEAILENPQIIMEAVQLLEQQEATAQAEAT